MKIVNISSGFMSANTYLIIDEETNISAIVDPGGDSAHIIAQISANGTRTEKILLTHGHYDHILALDDVRKAVGAKVYIHRYDNICLKNTTYSLMEHIGRRDTFDDADVLLSDGDEITIGSEKVKAVHTPGHTAGSVCYITDAGIITGDTLFFESIGRSDFPGGDAEALEESVRGLYALDGDYVLYPGHGQTTTLEHERKFNPYVRMQ